MKHLKIAIACSAVLMAFSSTSVAETPQSSNTQEQNERIEYFNFGRFEKWLIRNIKESAILGGNTKTLYAIAPNGTWNDNRAYRNQGGSPWATSNVLAKVSGITKTNTSVYRDTHPGHGYCAKLYTHLEECKVLGLVNIKVLAAGSIYLGQTQEPITGTSNPMSKLDAGVAFKKRPKALMFDYKVHLSGQKNRVRQTGFSKVQTISGMDMPDVILYLQKRWEDSNGNIHAKRVATLVQRFNKNTNGWVENARFDIHYGDIRKQSFYQSFMGLTSGDNTKYARNSKGKMVKVVEEGWASANETPTHIVLQFDSSHGGAYIGSVGNTFWIDNIRLVY